MSINLSGLQPPASDLPCIRAFAALLLVAGCVARACGAEPVPVAVAAPEWDAVFNRTDGWIGGDAIYSTALPGGDILWLFADTYLGQVRDGRRQPGVKMVNNTLARHPRPAAGQPPEPRSLEFLWGSDENGPAAWIRPDPALRPAGSDGSGRSYYWVADAVAAPGNSGKDRLLVFLWRIAPTDAKVFGFRNAGTALAIIDDPQADWRGWQHKQFDVTHARVAADAGQVPVDVAWGSEVLFDNTESRHPRLLIYGYRQRKGQPNELILAEAPASAVEHMDRWRFRTRDGWSKDTEQAAGLAGGITTEFSVSRIGSSSDSAWILVQSEPFLGNKIVIRRASAPWGPWSRPVAVYSVPDLDKTRQHFTYAAKAHPELSKPGELLISYVVNSFDFGESSTNADIYRPRFIRLSLDAR